MNPRDRKRRGDETRYDYGVCRRCRRLTIGAKPEPASITDAKLLHLLQVIYEYLWNLKERGFPGAPKKIVLQRLKSLLGVLEE